MEIRNMCMCVCTEPSKHTQKLHGWRYFIYIYIYMHMYTCIYILVKKKTSPMYLHDTLCEHAFAQILSMWSPGHQYQERIFSLHS